MGVIEIAELSLSQAMRRMETSAQNLANMVTPGFKAHRTFSLAPDDGTAAVSGAVRSVGQGAVDFSDGKLQQTGNPLDLAIMNDGFFVVRSDDGVFYTRNGQFRRDSNGMLITADGLIVQSISGDLHVEGDMKFLPDGTVLQNNEPVARLRIVGFDDLQKLTVAGPGLFGAPTELVRDVEDVQVRQGMLESSNVTTADEMLSIMAALRSAESSQRIVQVYDDLMGKAINTLGQ